MKISVFCLALFLSRVLCDRPTNAEHNQCRVEATETSIKLFHESLVDGKKVIFFRIRYDSKQADALTKSEPDDHFADPNGYMWLYNGEDGLPVYMNTPQNFELRSLFLLEEYTSNLEVHMDVSKSCNESTVSRVDFLRLVFRQLIRIVSTVHLPDKRTSAYVCYDINNSKNMPESIFIANKRLGLNRQILLRYCCEVEDYRTGYNKSIDLCRGKKLNRSNIIGIQTMVGAFLFAFFPLAIGFISWAKLNHHPQSFSFIPSDGSHFQNDDQYLPPFGTESSWQNEHDPYYSVLFFVRWLLLFENRSALASRIRRSASLVSFLLIIFGDLLWENFRIKEKLKSYLDNNIPLGYKGMIFGYEKSAENTDYFLGGPFVWFSAFVILGLIVINIPGRLCQTIAYSTLHQRETCTFLAQDIKLLQHYGNLKVSNLHDYDLLHAILKSSLMTALNPSFWCAVIMRWLGRYKSAYNLFNKPRLLYQLIGVCLALPLALISCSLCAGELLLCIVYYGCPMLQVAKSIPYSYTQCFIWPAFGNGSLRRRTLGVMCLVLSLPLYFFLFLSSTCVFAIAFQVFSFYVIYTVIALIAKPDAIALFLLIILFVYFLVSIAESISETYLSLQKLSIALAQRVCEDFVYIGLEERFIYRRLLERIVHRHHPIRYEISKALIKLAVGAYILASCAYAFKSISLDFSAGVKIGLLIFTSMIPKIMCVLKYTMLESRWKSLQILETIEVFQQETNFPNTLDINIL